jgi:hypothetical protein
LRHSQHRVNADPRNPDVLPIFLSIIPNHGLVHPQFFPMVSTNRAHRRWVTIGLVAVLGTSALAAMFGLGVLDAGARKRPTSIHRRSRTRQRPASPSIRAPISPTRS